MTVVATFYVYDAADPRHDDDLTILAAWAELCRAEDAIPDAPTDRAAFSTPVSEWDRWHAQARAVDAALAAAGLLATRGRAVEITPDTGDVVALWRRVGDKPASVDVIVVRARIASCGALGATSEHDQEASIQFLCRKAHWTRWADVLALEGGDHFGDAAP